MSAGGPESLVAADSRNLGVQDIRNEVGRQEAKAVRALGPPARKELSRPVPPGSPPSPHGWPGEAPAFTSPTALLCYPAVWLLPEIFWPSSPPVPSQALSDSSSSCTEPPQGWGSGSGEGIIPQVRAEAPSRGLGSPLRAASSQVGGPSASGSLRGSCRSLSPPPLPTGSKQRSPHGPGGQAAGRGTLQVLSPPPHTHTVSKPSGRG